MCVLLLSRAKSPTQKLEKEGKNCRKQFNGAVTTARSWVISVLHIPANLNLNFAEKDLAAELDGLAAVLQWAAAIGFRHNGSVK
jgi:hypothetical protein